MLADVFCDGPGGVLAAKHFSDAGDVVDFGLMTSSVSLNNARRSCSYIETSGHRDGQSPAIKHRQQRPSDVDKDEDEPVTGDSKVDEETSDGKLAECTRETETDRPTETTSDLSDELQQEEDIMATVNEIFHANALDTLSGDVHAVSAAIASSRRTDDESTPSQHSDEEQPQRSPQAKPVPPRRVGSIPTADETRSDKRPTPPVSRVKPMIRHTVTVQVPSEPLNSSSQPSSDTSTQQFKAASAAAAANAPSPGKVPGHNALNTVDDIPTNLDDLSVAEVAKCVTLLGLGQTYADVMVKQGVDGHQLITLTSSQLTDEFRFTPLDANKMTRFIRGWRPV